MFEGATIPKLWDLWQTKAPVGKSTPNSMLKVLVDGIVAEFNGYVIYTSIDYI